MQSSSHRSGIYRMRDRWIEGEAGRQAGRCLQTHGKGAKLESCEAARTGCAGGSDGEARKRPRKEP